MKKTAAKEETKQALIQAFWKLYREKRIEKITVGEIAAVAGYNRSTFYEYFYDVPDVLQQIEDGILDEMQFGIPGDRIPLEDVVALFERNADALSVLLGEHGDFSFFFRVRGKMRDAFHAPRRRKRRDGGLPPRSRDRTPRRRHHRLPALLAPPPRPPSRGNLPLRPALHRQRRGGTPACKIAEITLYLAVLKDKPRDQTHSGCLIWLFVVPGDARSE